MSPSLLRVVLLAYSVLMVVGGAMGASKSPISLIAGVVCGLLAGAGALLLAGNPKLGIGLALGGSLLAVGGMLPRFLKSHAVWPAGTVTVASALVLLLTIVALVQAGKSSS